jgi:hypothetical protein
MNPIRPIKRLVTIIMLAMICGCAEGPARREVADADYGPPLSIDYREAIREHMDALFFYWKTAQYKFTKPYTGGFRDEPELGGKINYGYMIDVLINAKNSKGKYIGFEPYTFLFRDNLLIRELAPETGAQRSHRPYEE